MQSDLRLFNEAVTFAETFAEGFLLKCDQSTTYKQCLGNFIESLLKIVFSEEWPAAALLVLVTSRALLRCFLNKELHQRERNDYFELFMNTAHEISNLRMGGLSSFVSKMKLGDNISGDVEIIESLFMDYFEEIPVEMFPLLAV